MKHIIWSVLFLIACEGSQEASNNKENVKSKVVAEAKPTQTEQLPEKACDELKKIQTITVAGHLIDIAVPADTVKIRANLFILQGWSFPKDDWCKKSSLCRKALAKGYRLIMPEMGKSTYQSQNYKETLADWRKYPTRKWLTDTLVPYLQEKYCILEQKQNNFVIGLSTGARGAGLVVLNLPDLFKGAAALSGDFDQRKMPYEKIMTGFYGSYQQFPQRWAGEDNMATQIKRFQTPFYLGHGKLDNVSPPEQTKLFYDLLKTNHPQLKVKLSMPTWAAHDYKYWDFEVDYVLSFFEELF